MDPQIFKAYDIRGVYGEQFAEEDAWKIGCATARFLPSLLTGFERGQGGGQSICVGRDMRTHSEPFITYLDFYCFIKGLVFPNKSLIPFFSLFIY